ncbi:MAG: hypothetical protein AB7G48_13735 [Nitrospiraceae bacterium]
MIQQHFVEPELDNARAWLRSEQRKIANTEHQSSNAQVITDAALQALEELTRFTPTEVPDLVRRGVFRYKRECEAARIARAQAIIRRVAPGPFEDPIYFATLAYQAASVEMACELLSQKPTSLDYFSKFLLGTLPLSEVNAFATKITKNSYTIVILHTALIDFIYQAAKAIVEALNPSRSVDGRSAVNAVFDLDVIRSRLDSDRRPAERLYRTLEAYFFAGYPRASAGEMIPEEHYPPLSLIVAMAERWVIGHEYGHGLAPWFERVHVPATVNVDWAEEYFSDSIATIATVYSAAKLDSLPPEFPLGGAIFALACFDLLQKGFHILLNGEETRSDPERGTHPEPSDRAVEVINCFRQYFDVNYYPNGEFDLTFTLREEVPKTHNFSSEHSKRAYAYTSLLQTLWRPVRERLLDEFHNNRPLHPLWRS